MITFNEFRRKRAMSGLESVHVTEGISRFFDILQYDLVRDTKINVKLDETNYDSSHLTEFRKIVDESNSYYKVLATEVAKFAKWDFPICLREAAASSPEETIAQNIQQTLDSYQQELKALFVSLLSSTTPEDDPIDIQRNAPGSPSSTVGTPEPPVPGSPSPTVGAQQPPVPGSPPSAAGSSSPFTPGSPPPSAGSSSFGSRSGPILNTPHPRRQPPDSWFKPSMWDRFKQRLKGGWNYIKNIGSHLHHVGKGDVRHEHSLHEHLESLLIEAEIAGLDKIDDLFSRLKRYLFKNINDYMQSIGRPGIVAPSGAAPTAPMTPTPTGSPSTGSSPGGSQSSNIGRSSPVTTGPLPPRDFGSTTISVGDTPSQHFSQDVRSPASGRPHVVRTTDIDDDGVDASDQDGPETLQALDPGLSSEELSLARSDDDQFWETFPYREPGKVNIHNIKILCKYAGVLPPQKVGKTLRETPEAFIDGLRARFKDPDVAKALDDGWVPANKVDWHKIISKKKKMTS